MSKSTDDTIEKTLTLTNEDGKVVIQVGLLATLYFERAHQADVREAIAACFEEYQALVGSRLRWAKHPETYRWYPAGGPDVPSVRDWLKEIDEDAEWEFSFHGGDDPDSASHLSVKALGSARWQDDLSYFRATLPITWFADHTGDFPALTLDFCRKIRPVSGYGGLGIIESPNDLIEAQFEPSVFITAQRFPGLEVDYPYSHILYLKEGIKGVNWLTIIGDRWLSQLGGLSKLRDQVGEELMFQEFPGGLIVRAGAQPQMGDLDVGRYPDLYVRLAAALKPIRVQKLGSFHHAGSNRFDQKTTERWLARFDPKG